MWDKELKYFKFLLMLMFCMEVIYLNISMNNQLETLNTNVTSAHKIDNFSCGFLNFV